MKRSFLTAAFLILVAAELAHAQTPCTWTEQTGSIVETCGSVGIGTTTPSTLFHVAGSTGQWAIFQRGTKRLYVNANWSDNDLWAQIAPRDTDNMGLSLSSKDNSPEYLFVATNGNIGIGTTAPADKLHIFNGTTAGGAVVITTPLASSFTANSPIGGLRLGWKVASSASNNVDLQVVRGNDALDGAGLAIFTSPSNTQTLERMRITSAGNVGVGTNTPSALLHVNGPFFGRAAYATYAADGVWHANARPSKFFMPNGQELRIGYADLGTSQYTPSLGFVMNTLNFTDTLPIVQTRVALGNAPESNNRFQISFGGELKWGSGAAAVDTSLYRSAANSLRTSASMTVDGALGVGAAPGAYKLHVVGNVNVTGSITGATVIGAVYQDVAEWVPAQTDIAPGTVVSVDPAVGNGVAASMTAYDTKVAGVVSAQPGIILGLAGDAKEQIATTGRVRVKVDASRAPIAVGDLLVTSEKPGMAMRSEPMEIGGRKFHQPGTIVGKALEALTEGQGEILVLLSLQ